MSYFSFRPGCKYRVEAFKQCILLTLVRLLSPFYESLSVSNVLELEDSKKLLLQNDLFRSFEPAMKEAKQSLLEATEKNYEANPGR